MIGRLTGILSVKRAPQILIDCRGVGYEVDVSMTTFYQLPDVGEQLAIWTHLLVKEDSHALIGFSSEQERKLFRQLIRISGVGAKMALTILSGIDNREFALCVSQNDVATLTRLPGVGKKTAERLIIEMRDKLGDLVPDSQAASGVGALAAGPERSHKREAIEALQALGYKPVDAEKMVRQVEPSLDSNVSAAEVIKKALQASISR
ncbi:MAG: Holliday junction branch migration protein RuvA [Proteobacteria bacterium]|nr:Holliday junction branch migration protein RuvA [Pseudomonadota bacterium]MCH8176895.1 Holliday junction branch migration protein RuvA [Pseudomonadota bacterium]